MQVDYVKRATKTKRDPRSGLVTFDFFAHYCVPLRFPMTNVGNKMKLVDLASIKMIAYFQLTRETSSVATPSEA